MISAKTVFVLGAGASNPFGFPLGSELKSLVLGNYNERSGHAVDLYNTTTLEQSEVVAFTEGLRYSGLSSVDAFLERRPEFLVVGKATMALELLICERVSNLWQDHANWLTYLFNNMIGNSLEEFAENRASFVTFNYDRTVEHFLHTSLKNSFGGSVEETAHVVGKIPIIHLHGRLGMLPWQDDGGIPYGSANVDVRTMDVLLNEIKVVHEDITDGRDIEFNRAHQLLKDAKRVYLLGFGFGARNVDRIGLSKIFPDDYAGTAYGLNTKEISQCRTLSGERVNLYQFQVLQFLRELASLD